MVKKIRANFNYMYDTCSYLAVPSCHQGRLITLLLKVTADPSVTRQIKKTSVLEAETRRHISMKEIQQHLMLDTFFQSQSDSFLLRAPREKKFIFAVN